MRKLLVISGRVQGVGCRYWLQSIANKKNIFGWVKNKIAGDVEALIVGNEKEVNDLIKLCEKVNNKFDSIIQEVKNNKKDYLKKSFDIIKSDQK
jgi:acylphosphatase